MAKKITTNKPPIMTGQSLSELESKLGVNQLHLQALLGIYSPSLIKIFATPDAPLDRLHSAIVRFAGTNKSFLNTYPVSQLFKQYDYSDLLKVYNKRTNNTLDGKFVLDDTILDLTNYAHVGIILFRGYGAARNVVNHESNSTLTISIWIGFVIECIKNKRSKLIMDIVKKEASAHDIPIEQLLKKAWPSLRGKK